MLPCGFKKYASALVRLVVGSCFAMAARGGVAEPAFQRTFDGPDISWQLLGTGVPAQIFAQECVAGGVRDKRGVERVVVWAAGGEAALLRGTGPTLAGAA